MLYLKEFALTEPMANYLLMCYSYCCSELLALGEVYLVAHLDIRTRESLAMVDTGGDLDDGLACG